MTIHKWPIPAPWDALIADYLAAQAAAGAPPTTLRTRRYHLAHLARGIEQPPTEVTGELLVSWAAKQTWKRETRRGRRTTLRAFWRWAVDSGRLTCNAAAALPPVPPSPPAPRPLPNSALEAAIARADERVRLILRLAVEAGLRRGEIAQVHANDLVDDLDGLSLVVHGKGGKLRLVPLTPSLAAAVRERCRGGYAFPGRVDGHLSAERVGRLAANALPAAWTLHAGRHRFATLAHRVCGDLLIVQDLLGHASPVTTRAYVGPDHRRARDVVAQLAA